MPDKRYVWKLKKALNGLVRQQAVPAVPVPTSARSGVRELPLATDPAEELDHRDHHGGACGRPDGQRSATGVGEALRGSGNAHCHEAGAAVALLGGDGLLGYKTLEHQIRVRGDAEGRLHRGHPDHCGTGGVACPRRARCGDAGHQGQAEDKGR